MNIYLSYKNDSGKPKLLPLITQLKVGVTPDSDICISHRSFEHCIVSRARNLVFVKNESNFDLILWDNAKKEEQSVVKGKLNQWKRGQCLQIGDRFFRLKHSYSIVEISQEIMRRRMVLILSAILLILLCIWQWQSADESADEALNTEAHDYTDPVESARYISAKCKSAAVALKRKLAAKAVSAQPVERIKIQELQFHLDHVIDVDDKLRTAMQNESTAPKESIKIYRSILVWIEKVNRLRTIDQQMDSSKFIEDSLLPGATQILSEGQCDQFMKEFPSMRELNTLRWIILSRLSRVS